MTTVIIVAAGTGERFGAETPKQFVNIHGVPVLRRTIERFEAAETIDRIVLVLSDDSRRRFEAMDLGCGITKLQSVVIGGSSRAESVRNGLAAVEAAEVVAVHDGARPLVSVAEIDEVIRKASETGAACLVAEVSDTIKHVENGEIVRTVDRTRLRRALTPQAFRMEVLTRAFADAGVSAAAATDEAYLVEAIGVPIHCVEGSTRNIKITRPEDIAVAEALLAEIEAEHKL